MTITVAGQQVTVTKEHPFYVPGQGWVLSGNLRVGDPIAQRDGGSVSIDAISYKDAEATVYNFEVDGDHNYYITEAWG
jgi:intein/homing endonuclease